MGEIKWYSGLTTIQVAKPRLSTVCEYPVSNLSYSVETRHVANIFVESSDKRKPLL